MYKIDINKEMSIKDFKNKLDELLLAGVSEDTILEIPMSGGFLNQVRDIKKLYSKLEERNALVIIAF